MEEPCRIRRRRKSLSIQPGARIYIFILTCIIYPSTKHPPPSVRGRRIRSTAAVVDNPGFASRIITTAAGFIAGQTGYNLFFPTPPAHHVHPLGDAALLTR